MSLSSSLLLRFPRYSIVSGLVTHSTDAGAYVALEGGLKGYIPKREFAWEDEPTSIDPLEEGQQVRAMILNEDLVRNHLVLSYRLVRRNPWLVVEDHYPLHTVHVGRVSQVHQHNVFIELEPGIEGLAHAHELPTNPISEEPIDLWPNDHVLVEVIHLDPIRHHMRLSMRSVVQRRDQQLLEEHYSRSQSGATIGEIIGARTDLLADVVLPWHDTNGKVHSILIVDDDHVFGSTVTTWLNDLGYKVTFASNLASGRRLVVKPEFDLILLDYRLDDDDGMQLAALASECSSDAAIVLMSTEFADKCNGELPPGVICWRKLTSIADLSELLRIVNTPGYEIPLPQESGHLALSLKTDLLQYSLASFEEIFSTQLQQLINVTGAKAAVAFGIGVGSQQVSIFAREGATMLLGDADLQQLLYSAVKDVCIEGKLIRTRDAQQQRPRFRHLLSVAKFRSFLGVPVSGVHKELSLGLFLFHPEPNVFTHSHQDHALLITELLAVALERRNVFQMAIASQREIFAGRFAEASAHEIRGQLVDLQAQVALMQTRFVTLRDRNERFNYATLIDLELPNIAFQLEQTIRNIGEMVNRQLQVTQPYKMSKFSLNNLVQQTADMLRYMATDEHIYITCRTDKDLPRIQGAPRLIQQILINLALNGIQQMAASGHYSGVLRVSTKYVPGTQRPVRVLFSDCGPGIHAVYYDKLFQQGFTTRDEGSGLGLYISRAIAEALGGHLHLVESFVGYGSIFELELPMSAPRNSDDTAK